MVTLERTIRLRSAGKEASAPRVLTATRVGALLVLLIACVVYLPSLKGLAIWDDHILLTGEAIGGGSSLLRCFTAPFLKHYFRPLVSVSFFIDHALFGTGPFFYHQTNILLHVLTTALLMALLRAAFPDRRVALLGGLLFAVQPVQVSAVAWIGGRTDALCAFWVALFAWTLVRAMQESGKRHQFWILDFGFWISPSNGWLAVSALAYGAALLTKEQALALLPLVPLAVRCFAPPRPLSERGSGWRVCLPFLAVSVLFVALWLIAYPEPLAPTHSPLLARLCRGGQTLAYYALLFLPATPQAMHTLDLGAMERAGLPAVLFGFGIAGLTILLFARTLRTVPAAAWFLALTALSLLPVSNLIPIPSLLVAPYRAGVAGLGVAAILGAALLGTLCPREAKIDFRQSKIENRKSKIAWCPLLAGAFVIWQLALTSWGVRQWDDEIHLFTTIVHYDPDSIIARYNLASALLQSYQTEPAIGYLEQTLDRLFGSPAWRDTRQAVAALRTNPDILARVRENQGNHVESMEWLGILYAQLGFARLQRDDTRGALTAFRTGNAIAPASAEINLGLGCCALLAHDDRQALRRLKIAVAAEPKLAEAHAKLGQVLVAQGQWRAARTEFQTWTRLRPWLGAAYTSLAEAQAALGDRAGAKATLIYALHHTICDPNGMQTRIARLELKGGTP